MSNFAIITDTNSELSPQMQKEYEIDAVIPGHIVTPDGVDHLSDTEWKLYPNPESFYAELRNKKKTFATSPPNVAELKECFEGFFKEGRDVLFVSLSSALSGTYNFAVMAAKELAEAYPERKAVILDSMRYSVALAILSYEAAKLRKEGKSLDETVAILDQKKNCLHEMGPMDDLFYLSRKGRVSFGAAFMGTMVGVKPMGDFNHEGMTTVITKALGINKALSMTVEYIKRTIIEPEKQTIVIAETDRKKNAEMLASLIEKEIKPENVVIITCGPSSGINIGPGLAAAFYFGKEISEGLAEETAIMNEIAGK